ncbi:MAG: AMP-binding protein [Deltaproteobacteria bacterium]|nr:AMP-binding protein [Deltaproteobacteria bacterium]
MENTDVYKTTRLTESYWPADRSKPLVNKSIGQVARETAAKVPDRIALVEGVADTPNRRRWTYAQLLAESEKVAVALLTKFEPGERVAVWADNVPEWVLMQIGCALAKVTLVTVNPANRIREIEYLLGQSEAAGVFLIAEYRGHKMLETINQIRDKLPHLREVISFSKFEDFVKSGSNSNVAFPTVTPEDPFVIMYTSGTTGAPKGAILTHNGMISCISYMAERAGLNTGVWVNVMPMFHMGGSFASLGCISQRATHVLAPAFDPILFSQLVEEEKGTFALLVPTMIEMLLSKPECKNYDLSTLETIQSGASKVETALIHRVKAEMNCDMCNAFGQTEAVSISLTHTDDSPEDKSETIGQPYPQIDVKIGDRETGEVLSLNEEGEICVRGYSVMKGYYNMTEETAKTVRDRWLHTGDLGSMDERGFLKITGRIKDMIIRGGENIYPAEVENLLMEHPKVAKAAVVGIPNQKWGEEIGAIIIPKSADDLPDPQELHDYCRANITHFKTPRIWAVTNEFPYTATGKIQKFMLKDLIVKGELKTKRT